MILPGPTPKLNYAAVNVFFQSMAVVAIFPSEKCNVLLAERGPRLIHGASDASVGGHNEGPGPGKL